MNNENNKMESEKIEKIRDGEFVPREVESWDELWDMHR